MLKLNLFDFDRCKSVSVCVPFISGDPVRSQIIVPIILHKIDSDFFLETLQRIGCKFMTPLGSDAMRMTIPMAIIDNIEDWGKNPIPLYCPH